jgi:MoaA/NifB/PqqE/SkfB family radical SAM enzyme
VGDPLQHPDCLDFISIAHEAGVQGIHVRTELQCSPELVERLARSEAKVITVDLNADTPETYRRAMGHDGFKMVIANMERLLCARRTIKGVGSTAIALPWVVPRIQRRLETIDDIEGFYERWQQLLGTPVIDAMPMTRSDFDTEVEVLANASNPARYMVAELFRRLVIYGDGSISLSEMDLSGQTIIGNVDQESLLEIWRKIVEVRRRILREDGPEAFNLRTYYS